MNTEQIGQVIQQLQGLWDAHVPSQYHLPVVPTALGFLILGVGLAVLGARLARGGLTLACASLGGLVAFSLRSHVSWSPSLLLAAGMVAGGVLGYVLFRLWVGVAAAAVCSLFALGVYGSRMIVPHFVDYDSVHNFNGSFVIPEAAESDISSPAESGGPSVERVEAWFRDFWLYVKSKESDVNTWVAGIALGAALFGFGVGSVLPRFTLILGTACLGTTLVLSGMAALAKHSKADLYDAALANPRTVGIVGLVLVATSLVLQGLLTRRPAAAAAPAGDAE